MRDPELVFNAQLAASSLERAWQRWRVVHGLVSGPMPAVSSYVGYSLEEPWGQPRVVFGLAAQDAEHLAALLDRHDCVGPVHATLAASGRRDLAAGTGSGRGLPLPVPPQAPSAAAGQASGEGLRPATRKTISGSRASRGADLADDLDGPVFRQVAAAAQQAAAARGDAWSAVGHEARQPDRAQAASGPGLATPAVDAPVLDAPVLDAPVLDAPVADDAVLDAPVLDAPVADDAVLDAPVLDAPVLDDAVLAGHQAEQVAEFSADELQSVPSPEVTAASEAEIPGEHPDGQARRGPGPLVLAASAAREEAESRIRAALLQGRLMARLEYPYAGSFDVTDPPGPDDAAVSGARSPSDASGTRAPVARYWMPRQRDRRARPGMASAWAGPDTSAQPARPAATQEAVDRRAAERETVDQETGEQAAREQDVVPFRPPPDLAAFADPGPEPDEASDEPYEADDEPDEAADERAENAGSSYTKRNRMSRGHSIPRLSRTRRSGAVPGA